MKLFRRIEDALSHKMLDQGHITDWMGPCQEIAALKLPGDRGKSFEKRDYAL
jgi:hypothetical protein